MLGGLAAAALLFAYAWWAPIVLGGAWLATHWWLRESAVWFDRNTDVVRSAQRDAEYTYRLAVDPAPAKELRLFGLAAWTIDRFVARRTLLHTLQYEATRLREKPVLWSVLLVTAANVVVLVAASDAFAAHQSWPDCRLRAGGDRRVDDRVLRVQLGARRQPLRWPPSSAKGRCGPPALLSGRRPANPRAKKSVPRRPFAYPGGATVLEHFDLRSPPDRSRSSDRTAPARPRSRNPHRLYGPQAGAIAIDGVDLLISISALARAGAACSRTYPRRLPLRDNVKR
jgi:hypothetical protein